MSQPFDPLDPNPDPIMEYGLEHTGWARQPGRAFGPAVFDAESRRKTRAMYIFSEPETPNPIHPEPGKNCHWGAGSYGLDEEEAEWLAENQDPDGLTDVE